MSVNPVEPVAKSTDEFALLADIAQHLSDDDKRLKYATWLESQGDGRGLLLRSFMDAFVAKRDLPALDRYPQPWIDLTGLAIMERIATAKLHKFRDQILALARPALHLIVAEANFEDPPETPPEIGTTRLGGDPDLASAVHPVEQDGNPLHFIGQFNVSDFDGTIAGLAFPDSGLISIFRPVSFFIADKPKIVQFARPGASLQRVERPNSKTGNLPPYDRAPYRPDLRIVETLRLPASLRRWPGVSLTKSQDSQFDEACKNTKLGSEMFHLLGHATHGNTGEEPLAQRPDWRQLISIPFFEGPDFGVNDFSYSFQLPAADLKAGRFDRLDATFG